MLACLAALCTTGTLQPTVATEPVLHDADDPAIWVAPNPEASLVLGTDKGGATGNLYVFGLDGKVRQRIEGLLRPNNVDVESRCRIGGRLMDVAVVSERGAGRLRVFSINPRTGKLADVSGKTHVFRGRGHADSVPMGVGLYRSREGAVYAVVSPKSGPITGYLALYALEGNGGKVDLRHVSDFGRFSGAGEIEAVLVDDRSGEVYYCDEDFALWRTSGLFKGAPASSRFQTPEYLGDREGLALYGSGTGRLLLSCDQVADESRLFFYLPGESHRLVGVVTTTADDTDGIEATSVPLGSRFPEGVLVMMNSKGRNFFLYDWRSVRAMLPPSNRPHGQDWRGPARAGAALYHGAL